MDGTDARLRISRIPPARPVGSLLDDVRQGLLAPPRRLPAKYFYDERGAKLFEDICATQDYYPSRCEAQLLETHGAALMQAMDARHLIELGSGSSRKTRHLLEHAAPGTIYWPFDVSEEMLRSSAAGLVAEWSGLQVHGLVGDYHAGLDLPIPDEGRRSVLFLGGTLGNFRPEQAEVFLGEIRGLLRAGDTLLLGADRVKAPGVLERAYDDREGVTAAFNLNVLRVLNRELDADFDLDGFSHRAVYNTEAERIEMYLESQREQAVRIGRLDQTLQFTAGERIRTELSHKYSEASLTALLEPAGFRIEQLLTTPEPTAYSLVLARAVD